MESPLFVPVLILASVASAASVAEPSETPLLPAPPRFEAVPHDPLLEPAPRPARVVASWDEALSLLHATSTDERTAVAGLERAEGRIKQSLSTLLPNLRANGAVAVDLLNPANPTLGSGAGAGGLGGLAGGAEGGPTAPLGWLSVSATQSLVDVGAWRGLDAAKAGQRGAVATLADVRRRLTQGLARALVSVVAAERVAELNRLGLRHALEREALTRRTLELGAATQLDLVRVSQDVELARAAVIAGDEQLHRTREALALALGQPGEVGVPPSFEIVSLVEGTRARCSAIADVTERPDLQGAQANLEAAQKSREQASAGYLPTLGLSSSAFAFTTDPGPGRVATWSLAAVFSVPLWEGGLREGLVRERQAVETQAAEALERTRREASQEIARSRRNVEVAERLLQTAAQARSFAERNDVLTRKSFEVGRSGSLELVQSAAALRSADVTLVAREFDFVQARLDAFLTEATCAF